MKDILYDYLSNLCGKDSVAVNVMLWQKTTFKIGGAAKYFINVKSKEILPRLISALNFVQEPYFIIGMGANVLADSAGYDGAVIKLNFNEITHTDNFIYADAGAKLGVVCNYARDNNLSGLEWAAGIPASIGGAVYMNCGAFGREMKDVIVMIDVLESGEIKTLTNTDLQFAYRTNILHKRKNAVVLGAYLRMTKSDKEIIAGEMKAIIAKRMSHPKEPSAGSVFLRPYDGFYVGKVIEELGFKGHKIGGAMVSQSHGNFIINTGGATSEDVLALIDEIQTKVKKETGVELHHEIVLLKK
jgi:UDP-N-acetylmuramate dehydrogenase